MAQGTVRSPLHCAPGGTATLKEILAAQSALTGLIIFCSESQDLNPLSRTGVPIAKHQLLLLDTGVHSLVISLLSAPFQESGGATAAYSLGDLESPKCVELSKTCDLCYRLLQQMVRGTPAFAFRLSGYIPFMQSQLGYCQFAANTMSEMFHNNRKLLEQMPSRIVTCFVRLCTERVRQAGYLKFLCELCVCDGHGVLSNQTVICKRLLEENSSLLLPLVLSDNSVIVGVPDDEASRMV